MLSVRFDQDGRCLAVLTESGTIGVLDAGSRSYSTVFRGHTNVSAPLFLYPLLQQQVTAVAVDSTGMRCASAARDGTLRIWSLVSP